MTAMRSQVAPTRGFSIRRLRTFILVALVAGVSVFTGVMFTLVQSLSERFGPQVQADLEWRALRGAQELSRTADIGLAVSDAAMVTEPFGVYASSSDIQAIVAIDSAGGVVARHGAIASIEPVLAAAGAIEIATAANRGTTFRFQFPGGAAPILPVRVPTQPIRSKPSSGGGASVRS
jgi:hypothetical protein